MDNSTLGIIVLRGIAMFAGAQGEHGKAKAADSLADAIESRRDVDQHMREFAAALKAGEEAPWEDINDRITAETDEFLAR